MGDILPTVTRVQVYPLREPQGKTKAFARVVLSDALQLTGLRVVDGMNGLFVAYPNDPCYKGDDYRSLYYPLQKGLRDDIEARVLMEYHLAKDGRDMLGIAVAACDSDIGRRYYQGQLSVPSLKRDRAELLEHLQKVEALLEKITGVGEEGYLLGILEDNAPSAMMFSSSEVEKEALTAFLENGISFGAKDNGTPKRSRRKNGKQLS